jgi:hypothetical protein
MGRTSTIYIDPVKSRKLYDEGLGWRAIGRILNIHPYQIQIHFEKLGLKAHNKVGGAREWDTDKFDQMIWCGCSIKQASKELDVSQSTLYKYLREKKKSGKE